MPISDPDVPPRLHRIRAQAAADLERYLELVQAADKQRIQLALQCIAAELAVDAPSVTTFAVLGPSTIAFFNTYGVPIDIPDSTLKRVRNLLSTHSLIRYPELLPDEATIIETPGYNRWYIPVASIIDHSWHDSFSIVDVRQLSEGDYARVHQVAEEQLGAVGVVRMRGDFLQQIQDYECLREDVTEEQVALAAEAARLRYEHALEEIGFSSRVFSRLFVDTVHEAAYQFNLVDNPPVQDSSAGTAEGRQALGPDL